MMALDAYVALADLGSQLDNGKGLAQTVKDADKRGDIHFAASEGNTELCKYLLEDLKLDVDTRDDDGETPLIHAARQGHTATAKYLTEYGANPAISCGLGATALHHAAGIGDIELLQFLVLRGVGVDSQSDAGTPLIWAARHGKPDAVKILLEHHADPNIETDDGITPLFSAVAAGSVLCVELLIQAGANVNVTEGGATPLHFAADEGNAELIKCLVKAGADVDVTDEDGLKAIQLAAARGNRIAVEILFPLTSQLQTVEDWTIDGILECMQSGAGDGQVTVEAKKRAAAQAKSRGNSAFKCKDFMMAVDAYTQAIDFDPGDAILLSKRSLCWLRLGQADLALSDAQSCRVLRPDWPKACYLEDSALRLMQVTVEAKKRAAAQAKSRGNSAFKCKDFMMAVDAYTQAINFDPGDAILLSNRSLCWLRLGQADHALSDAQSCRVLRPDWPKASYREGAALRLMQRFEEAAIAFYEGLQLDPENMELENAFREAVEAGLKFHDMEEKMATVAVVE